MQGNLLGIDLGTTKVAIVILDGSGKRFLGIVSEAHHAGLSTEADAAEQSVEKIIDTVRTLLHKLPAGELKRVRAVGVTGQMHSVTGWTRDCKLFPLVTWQDRRCGQQDLLEIFRQRSGHSLRDGFGCATLARLATEGRLADWAGAVALADYLVMTLTGNSQSVCDPSHAASWGLYDPAAGDWDFSAASSLGIPRSLLPCIRQSGAVAGKISRDAAMAFGLPEGILVMNGIGDNQASIIALGADFEHEVFLTLGTGAQLSLVMSATEAHEFCALPCVEIRPFINGNLLAVSAPLLGGRAYAWLAEVANHWLAAFGREPMEEKAALALLDQLGCDVLNKGAGEGGLSFCPSLIGERHAPELRGKIEGITLDNFTPGNLAAALAVGIVRNLKMGFPDGLPGKRNRILGSGNGIRLVKSIQIAIRREFGMDLELPDNREEAACGCAILAGRLTS